MMVSYHIFQRKFSACRKTGRNYFLKRILDNLQIVERKNQKRRKSSTMNSKNQGISNQCPKLEKGNSQRKEFNVQKKSLVATQDDSN